jgi:putative endonuclease
MKQFYIYILSSHTKTLYIGVTNNLQKRVYEHKNKLVPGFTKKYNITKLAYYEITNNSISAINREKKLKGWLRKKKIDLIQLNNPEWKDLSDEFLEI